MLALARAGDSAAYEELYRAHLDGARNLARILVGTDQADELVAESFARVLSALRSGGGPTDNFRSYLHVTIRNGYRDGLRATTEAPVSDQPWLLDDAEPAPEEMVEGLDETVAVDALSSLPESWQKVLWHVEVEGRKPAEVAEILDMRPGAVSSLAHRAREGLKRAYLDHHAGPAPAAQDCQWAHQRMSQHARGDLGARAEQKFDAHLDACDRCSAAYLSVSAVNQKLAGYVLPAVLLLALPGAGKGLLWLGGAAAAGGAGAAGASGGASGGAGGGGGATTGIAVAAASVVVVGAVAASALALRSGDDKPEAEPPPSAGATEVADVPDPADPAPSGAPKPEPSQEPEPEPTPVDDPVDDTEPTEPPDDPTDPTDPTDPSDPDTSEPPADEKVVPEAPTATPITQCATDGNLEMATTEGVTYELVTGNGREGRWKVVASARPDYVIADGAQRTFAGDLGDRFACGRLVSVTSTRVNPSGRLLDDLLAVLAPPSHRWNLRAEVAVDDGPVRDVQVVFVFDNQVEIDSGPGAGWSCSHGGVVPAGTPLVCGFHYTGSSPPTLELQAHRSLSAASPNGTATFRDDGKQIGGAHEVTGDPTG
nr:sigma-70 family RNA polymerase sigma factor [Nocardioides thalensis]